MLRLRKQFSTPTWSAEDNFTDTLESTMVVSGKTYTWDINQSTRPVVQSRLYEVLATAPTEQWGGTETAIEPLGHRDHKFTVTAADQEVMKVTVDWPTPDGLDLEVYRVTGYDAEGNPQLEEVGGSGSFVGEKEEALFSDPVPGEYIVRVINFASAAPSYTWAAGVYDATTESTPENEALIENYTLTCERPNGEVLQSVPVIVDRGQHLKVDLRECSRRF